MQYPTVPKHLQSSIVRKVDSVNNLLSALESSVQKACEGADKVGLIFSAGMDSTIVGVVASKFAEVRAYNVGVEGSHDSSHAREVEKQLPFRVSYVGLDPTLLEKALPAIVEVVGVQNPLKVSVAVPFHFASKKAFEDGIGIMLCGQGPDELFGGYNRYLKTVSEKGYGALAAELEGDVGAVWESQLKYDHAVAKSNGVELRFPYLDDAFKSAALLVPAQEKIKKFSGECEYGCVDETPGGRYVRKYVLRKVAERAGVPKVILDRPKKAAQYGSGSEKLVGEIAKSRGFSGRNGMGDYLKSLM
jgi:asparagine synthase (glutamine-hydrolysing)